jgi:hypothetical protein
MRETTKNPVTAAGISAEITTEYLPLNFNGKMLKHYMLKMPNLRNFERQLRK